MKRPGYAFTYVMLLVLLAVGSLYLPDGGVISDEIKLNDKGKAILDALTEMEAFVGGLNTILLGACGALAVKGGDWSARWGRVESYAVMVVFLAGTSSYYGLYLSRIAILEMLSGGIIDPFSRRLQGAITLQYYAFIMGGIMLGLVFVLMLDAKKTDALQR